MNHDIERTTGPCMRCGKSTSFDSEYCHKCELTFDAEDDCVDARYEVLSAFETLLKDWRADDDDACYCPKCKGGYVYATREIMLDILEVFYPNILDPYARSQPSLTCDNCKHTLESSELPYMIEED